MADRFHVCKNLTEATQLLLARCQAAIAAAGKGDEPTQNESGQPTISIEEWRPKEPAHVEKVRLTRRAERKARYEQVMQGRSRGLTAKEIAGQLNMSERTVRTWLAAGTFPEARKRRKKPSSFDPFAPYVLKRWQEGEQNGLVLWREIQKQGYTGSERTGYRHIETRHSGERSGFPQSQSSPHVYSEHRRLAVCPRPQELGRGRTRGSGDMRPRQPHPQTDI